MIVQGPPSPCRLLVAMEALQDERWGDRMQQDAQEFLHALLDQLQIELNTASCPIGSKLQKQPSVSRGSMAEQAAAAWAAARRRQDSCISDIFCGQLMSAVTCGGCGAVSRCFEDFLDLSLPIPAGRVVSIQDCLRAFTDSEALDEDAGFECGACKQRVCSAAKRLSVQRCPPVLVLTLNRFSAGAPPSWHGTAVSKNTTRITMQPHCLDMQPYCSSGGSSSASVNALFKTIAADSCSSDGTTLIAAACSSVLSEPAVPHLQVRTTGGEKHCAPPIYDLAAIVHHCGTLDGGHYTAQCRHPGSSQWHKFDDAAVADTTATSVSASAYILFYTRQH